MRIFILISLLMAFASSCSKTEDKKASASSNPPLVTATKEAAAALKKAQFDNDRSASFAESGELSQLATQTQWDNSTLWNPWYNSSADPSSEASPSPAKIMEIMIGEPRRESDSGTKKNVSGYITAGLDTVCLSAAVLGGSELPAAGTYTIELTPSGMSSLNSTCGTTMTLTETSELTITVTDVTATNFDKKIQITGSERTEYMLIRMTDDLINFGLAEKGQDGDSTRFIRTLGTIDRATGVARVEWIMREGNGGYTRIARAYIDESDALVAAYADQTTGSKSLQAGINFANSGGQASVYFKHSDDGWADDVLCIDTDNGDIVTTNAVCAGRDIGTSGVWDFSSVVTAVKAISLPVASEAIGAGGWKLTEDMGVPSFTRSTIWTAAIATNP